MVIRLGFAFGAGCEPAADHFHEVIVRGERYLATCSRSPVRGEVELLVAEGYSDVVAVTSGAAYVPGDSAKYAGQTASAWAKAIKHVREGYRLAGASSRARDDWADAWRLVAGLPPNGTHFYCIND